MAADPIITQAVAQSLLTAFETAANAGTAAVINGYDDDAAVPADADASAAGSEITFTLTCSAAIFATKTDGTPDAVGTFDTITDDSSADVTDTVSFFRILTQAAGTVVFQGTVATSSADMIINTTAITAGSTVSCSSATITVPEQA